MELVEKYRPGDFDEVYGQPEAVETLKCMVKRKEVPKSVLFVGPSGCGKTTCARILAKKVKCHEMDLREVNSADYRGIDTIREMRQTAPLAPMGGAGHKRVWVLDEAHKLTNDAQNALLVLLESGPAHCHFFLCTTEPDKLIETVQSRCTVVHVKPLPDEECWKMLAAVVASEKDAVDEKVLDLIVEVSQGSARRALKLLDQVKDMTDPEAMLNAVQSTAVKKEAIDLCRELLSHKGSWNNAKRILSKMEEEPESVRRMILAYASKALVSGRNDARAHLVLQSFRDNFFDCGRAGLVMAAYEVLHK